MTQPRWLLLTHQLPSDPSNIRVKVWRKLQAFGAVPIKNSIYVLPNRAESREDFEWLRKEIAQMKGDASVFLADSITDLEDKDIVEAFRRARSQEFEALIKKTTALAQGIKNTLEGGPPGDEAFRRLHRQWSVLRSEWERLHKIDFFEAPNRKKAESAIETAQQLISRAEALRRKGTPQPPAQVEGAKLKDKVWVTRASPHIDRLASAWLIRRHVDPAARFKFVAEPYAARRSEIRFDMSEAEFTHFGDWCTFETFLHRLKLSDPGLNELAEIIHDIDLKDEKFGRSEAHGVGMAVQGICRIHKKDSVRLDAGIAFFDALYAAVAANGEKKSHG